MIRESNFVLHELHLLNQMEETFYVSVFFKVTESVIVIHDSSSYWFVVCGGTSHLESSTYGSARPGSKGPS